MKENYLEALKWYGKAADMGNAEAKYKLGKILWEEGKRYLLESCGQGNIAASEIIEGKQIDVPYIVFISPKSFGISARKTWNGTIEYSLDKINWHDWDGSQIESNIIYMRGYGNTVITGYHDTDVRWKFETKDKLICRGNIETLLDYKICSKGEHPPMGKSCYDSMFKGCTSLLESPALPARELSDSCYHLMFSGCTSLEKAPVLPAKKLAEFCYMEMFEGCKSLSEVSPLPATELAKGCYNRMFEGCTSLVKASALPATELAELCCCSMFEGCTSLKKTPALPATKLVDRCYMEMFKGCTSLLEAPALPATKLAWHCYESMFKGCTSLKDRSNLLESCFE